MAGDEAPKKPKVKKHKTRKSVTEVAAEERPATVEVVEAEVQEKKEVKLPSFYGIGEPVPRHVGVVYLHDMQIESNGIRGFTSEELTTLIEGFFTVCQVSPGTNVITEDKEASYFAIILQGRGIFSKKGKRQEFTGLIGDFVGTDTFFSVAEGAPLPRHDQTFTASDVVNIFLVCPFAAMLKLYQHDSILGYKMLRLTSEAASRAIFAPSGVPLLLKPAYLEEDANRFKLKAQLHNLELRGIVQDMSTEDIETMSEMVEVVSCYRGSLVFHAGHQTMTTLVLLSGVLEVKALDGTTTNVIDKSGEVVGESLIPHMAHKGNTFCVASGKLLSITLKSLVELTKAHPVLGFKLTRNMARETFKKMKVLFMPNGVHHNPEHTETNDIDKELRELRSATSGKLQEVILAGLKAQHPLEDTGRLYDEVRNYHGAVAVDQVAFVTRDLISDLKLHHANFEEYKANHVSYKLFNSKVKECQTLYNENVEMRREMNTKTIEVEKAGLTMQEAVQKTSLLKELLEETEELRQEALKDSGDLKQKIETQNGIIANQGSKLRKALIEKDRKAAGGEGDETWAVVVKGLRQRADAREEVINKLQETVQELNLKKEELEERNKKLNAKNMMHMTALLQSEKDRMVQLSAVRDLDREDVRDETIPLMEAKLQVYAGKASLLHWTHMVYKLIHDTRMKNVSITMASDLIKYRGEALLKVTFQEKAANDERRADDMEAQRNKYKELHDNLAQMLNQFEQDLEVYRGNNTRTPEFQMAQMRIIVLEKDCARFLQEQRAWKMYLQEQHQWSSALGELCSWLVMGVNQVEVQAGEVRPLLLWTSDAFALLKDCWEHLHQRGMLSPEADQLSLERFAQHRMIPTNPHDATASTPYSRRPYATTYAIEAQSRAYSPLGVQLVKGKRQNNFTLSPAGSSPGLDARSESCPPTFDGRGMGEGDRRGQDGRQRIVSNLDGLGENSVRNGRQRVVNNHATSVSNVTKSRLSYSETSNLDGFDENPYSPYSYSESQMENPLRSDQSRASDLTAGDLRSSSCLPTLGWATPPGSTKSRGGRAASTMTSPLASSLPANEKHPPSAKWFARQ